jgi:hypothetical protein
MRTVGTQLGLVSARSTILLVLLGSALPASMTAHAQSSEPTIEQLQKELRQRDTIIRNLVRRVERLERQVGKGASAAANSAAGPARSEAKSETEAQPPVPTVAAPTPGEPTPAPAGPKISTGSAAAGTQQPATTNPGELELSEEAAERALDRALVATGNLLVPKGFAEVQPLVSYTRSEQPTQVSFNLNRNEFSGALDMRLGLPWESQFEISLPYNLAQQQVTDVALAPPQQVSSKWANAVGDLTIGLANDFMHESGWTPELVGRVAYEVPTGPESRNNVPLSSDRSLLAFSLTATKRQDPLVFVASGGYTKLFETDGINLGDQVNLLTGVFLASSPETSLRAVLQSNFVQDVTVNDVTIKGSDTVPTVLNFGASSILGRGILIDLQVGAGLTSSAPKYSVTLSGTYRFPVSGP